MKVRKELIENASVIKIATPEERAWADGYVDCLIEIGTMNVDRLRELAEADKAERVMVLPCKVGQRVFALLDTDKYISECEVKHIELGNGLGFAGIEPIGARGRECGVSLKGFGKTVFLTLEAAERALEEVKRDG